MRVIKTLDELNRVQLPPAVVALGTFDGVHLGHQNIISCAKDHATAKNLLSMVFTFSNHPLAELLPEKVPPLLLEPNDKEQILASLGTDILINIPFDEQFAQLKTKEFVALLHKCNVQAAIVGENYSYGFLGQGNVKTLKQEAAEHNIEIIVLPLLTLEHNIVSSSNIRRLIHDGQIELANKMLGREYALSGIVTKGDQRGRLIGYPTANLVLTNTPYTLPQSGVYAGHVLYNKVNYKALVNVGTNPTFNNKELRLEAHLLHFDEDIYAKTVRVALSAFVREERTFASVRELKKQIITDQDKIELILK